MDDKLSGVCYICGHDLVWDENSDNCTLTDLTSDMGEGYICKEILCPECGTLHTAWVNVAENDEENVGYIGDQGFGNCIHCGSTLSWSGDFMRSDFDESLSEEDDSIVRSLCCSGCGCSVDVVEPSENEAKSGKYPHWRGYEES